MKNYNTILIEKQPKISVLSSNKLGKYEYLTGKEILSFFGKSCSKTNKCN